MTGRPLDALIAAAAIVPLGSGVAVVAVVPIWEGPASITALVALLAFGTALGIGISVSEPVIRRAAERRATGKP